MRNELLELTPTRYLCPCCGEWHEWNEKELEYYDGECDQTELECPNTSIMHCYNCKYGIYFENGYCYYSIMQVHGRIPISSISESKDNPIVTWQVSHIPNENIPRCECMDCSFKDECRCGKFGMTRHYIDITFGFEFKQSDYDKYSEEAFLRSKEKEKEHECKQTLKEEEVSQRPHVEEKNENTTMKNIFNINMEFGPIQDGNIASTIMGIAVKNGDSWRIYNKNKKKITDVGEMKLSNLPILILPTTKLREGDLIKDDGEYYFVTTVATSKTPTQTISARTGREKRVIPIKNLLGFSCYSKVIALSDWLNIGDDIDVEKLAIMVAMSYLMLDILMGKVHDDSNK